MVISEMAVSETVKKKQSMRFYDREQEIAFFKETRQTAERVARFTVYDLWHTHLKT